MSSEFFHPRYLVTRHSGSDSATVLRGIACIMVFLIHSGGAVRTLFSSSNPLNHFLNWFVDLGSFGPHIFFIASGYALSRSCSIKRTSVFAFGLKRWLRLAPLYFAVLSFMFLTRWPLNDFGVKSLVMRTFFIDGLWCDGQIADPTGVAWTMPVEFYCSFIVAIIAYRIIKIKDKIANHLSLLLGFSLFTILVRKMFPNISWCQYSNLLQFIYLFWGQQYLHLREWCTNLSL